MPLGTAVGLGPGHIVLDGDPAPATAHPPIFGPCLLWPNGWMNQDVTWYRGRPRPIVLDGDLAPYRKGQSSRAPIFGPNLLWPNGRPFQQLLSSCFTFILKAVAPCKNKIILKHFRPEPPPSVDRPKII